MPEKSTGGEPHNNKSIFDSLFKIAVIVLGIVYVALYYNQSLNGRYIVVDKDVFPPLFLIPGLAFTIPSTKRPIL